MNFLLFPVIAIFHFSAANVALYMLSISIGPFDMEKYLYFLSTAVYVLCFISILKMGLCLPLPRLDVL